jgi:hypothetical protein
MAGGVERFGPGREHQASVPVVSVPDSCCGALGCIQWNASSTFQ